MNKSIYFGTVAVVLAFALIYVSVANAQNVTTNASNAAGNASAGLNKTGSELGKNASNAAGNASAGLNKTGSELGKNISKVGGEVVNKTEDVLSLIHI